MLGTAALAGGRAWAFRVPAGQQISCKVMRKGSDIGRATYTFDQRGDALTVRMSVDIRVKLGFITMFHYALENVEQWQGEQLMRFASKTNDNGTPRFATAAWNGSALAVTGSKTRPYVAPARALGSSYWNPRTLTDPLIDAQDGKLLDIRILNMGPSAAVLSTGRTVPANEYRMTGDLRANLWYDDSKTWSGMQYFAHDGSVITYEKM